MNTLIEYTITASRNGRIVDAEEVRGFGQARRVFDARVEQWRDSGETVTLTWTDDRGTLIKDSEIN